MQGKKHYQKKMFISVQLSDFWPFPIFRNTKVNTNGLSQANKLKHMAAVAYNLTKDLKLTQTSIKRFAVKFLFK